VGKLVAKAAARRTTAVVNFMVLSFEGRMRKTN
jgi:hypothetical protein